MSGHTPGPWVTADRAVTDSAHTTIKQRTSGKYIAWAAVGAFECGNGVDTTAADEAVANARLIATAPDLLDALVLALPYVEDCEASPEFKPGVVAAQVRAIKRCIALATGERA